MKPPAISVVMSAYNAGPYIREAIQSILDQTFADFEFLIYNDGSKDNTAEVIRSFTDPRIQFFDLKVNRWLVKNVNEGIGRARGNYIARMDADDVSLPERFAKEHAFLEAHPDFALIGGWIEKIDSQGRLINDMWKFPASPEEIPILLLFNNYFAQPTVMLRKSMLPKILYREEIIAEDYELWSRISDVHKVWNLQEVLVRYRVHPTNTGTLTKKINEESVLVIFKERLTRLGIDPTEEEIHFHNSLSFKEMKIDRAVLAKADAWHVKIYTANLTSKRYDKVLLFKTLVGRWYILCKKCENGGFSAFFASRLFRESDLDYKDYFRLTHILWLRLFRK